jgi:hypothetical protein
MLDDKVWQVLAELPAPEALAIIDDAGQALLNPHAQIRNINAYFMVSSLHCYLLLSRPNMLLVMLLVISRSVIDITLVRYAHSNDGAAEWSFS